MSIKIRYLNSKISTTKANVVLFTNEKFNLGQINKFISNSEFNYIKDFLKTSDGKKNLLVLEVNSQKKIILIKIKNHLKNSDIENLGAEFYGCINKGKSSEYVIISDSIESKNNNLLGYFLHGLKLKSYEFKKYKTKKNNKIISINVSGKKK